MQDRGEFGVQETVEPDGRVRVRLLGELDHATTDGLVERLAQLKQAGSPVRLDLSELEFIDSSGIRTLLITLREAERDDWSLEVDRSLSWQVERVINVLGIDAVLWPDGDGPADGSA